MLGSARGEDEGEAGEAVEKDRRESEAGRKKTSHSEVDARHAPRADRGGAAQFRIMLSLVRPATALDPTKDELAAIVIHTGRPPIARWTVAQWKGQKKPKSADDLPTIASSTGWLALIDASAGSPGVLEQTDAKGTQTDEDTLTDGF